MIVVTSKNFLWPFLNRTSASHSTYWPLGIFPVMADPSPFQLFVSLAKLHTYSHFTGQRIVAARRTELRLCIKNRKPQHHHSISPKDNLKYLGVLLENKLSWKPHVQKVKNQLSRACGVLSKLKHYTTQSILKVVYNSLIHPYLNYSILNWGRASNATIQLLSKLQNKAIKLMRPTNTASLKEIFQHLNILCLPKLYTLSVGKFMHSYYNKLFPKHFDEYFIPISSIHSYSRRLSTSNDLYSVFTLS